MEMTYSKEMREFMRLHDLAHKKGDAKAAFQLANILLKIQKPSLDKAAIQYLGLANAMKPGRGWQKTLCWLSIGTKESTTHCSSTF